MRIKKISSIVLVVAFALLVAQLPASADTLEVYIDDCSGAPSTQTVSGNSGPLTVPFSCSPSGVGAASGTVSANYLPFGSGSLVNYAGGGNIDAIADSFVTVTIASTTLPSGTPIALTFVGSLSGSYSYSSGSLFVSDAIIAQIYFQGSYILNYNQTLDFCNPTWSGCGVGSQSEAVPSASGSGSLSVPFAPTVDTTVGSVVGLSTTFEQDFGQGGSSPLSMLISSIHL